jgi:PAS domain S-box-containing protein
MKGCTGPVEARSNSSQEGIAVLAQSVGGTALYLISAIFALIILGMAVNEWRRLGKDEYKRIAIAAGILLLGRMLGLLVVLLDWQPIVAWQEWILEGLTLAVFVWAFLFDSFSVPRRALLFLGVATTSIGGLAVLCLVLETESPAFPWANTCWSSVLLLLSIFGLLQWGRYRQRFSPLLGSTFLISALGDAGALVGFPLGARLAHLAILPLLAIETYRSILADWGGYGRELQTESQQTLQQTQRVTFLLEVSRAIMASLELPVVLERVVESIARAIDADWAYILLPASEDPEMLVVTARYGWWGRRWTQDSHLSRRVVIGLSDFSLIRHAFLRQRQVLANRPDDYEQFEPLHDLLARPQAGPTLIQPIYLGDRSLGVLLLGRIETSPRESGKARRELSDADAELCAALAVQVATAMRNARLHQSLNEQVSRATESLSAREEKIIQFQAILESIADGVMVAAEDGEVVLVNAAAERILAVPRQRLLDQTISRLYAELLQATGAQGDEQVVFQWNDKVIMSSLAVVKMLDGALLGHVAVFRDVTRERQAEQARAEFVATVSEQLQMRLTSIQGHLEGLSADVTGDADLEERLPVSSIRTDGEQMAELVDELKVMSEMERGAIKIEHQAVDMRELIEEAVEAIRAKAESSQVELTANVPSDLNPAWGDPRRLRQIMGSLLGNAVRDTPESGRVAVWAAEAHLENNGASAESCLVISVRDSGMGLAVEVQDRTGETVSRLDNWPSDAGRGIGIELAITKSLVEAHGGRMWVESSAGAGSTFSFTIPTASAM